MIKLAIAIGEIVNILKNSGVDELDFSYNDPTEKDEDGESVGHWISVSSDRLDPKATIAFEAHKDKLINIIVQDILPELVPSLDGLHSTNSLELKFKRYETKLKFYNATPNYEHTFNPLRITFTSNYIWMANNLTTGK